MPNFCAAIGCTNNSSKSANISFHRFPLSSATLLERWVTVLRRAHFTPTKYSRICSEHFTPEDFVDSIKSKRKLKHDAVPTIFNFPSHLQKNITLRQTKKRPLDMPSTSVDEEEGPSYDGDTAAEHSYAADLDDTLETLKTTKLTLQKKVKCLGRKVQRKHQVVGQLKDLLADLKKQHLLEADPAVVIEKCFDGNILEIVKNELVNVSRTPKGRRYSQAVKQFALTLHYYSPQAYKFCQTMLSLPHPSSIQHWLGNIDCEPGFLTNIIEVCSQSVCKDFSLVIDSMSIMQQTSFNNGKFFGFCDYGTMVAEDSDKLCSEVLVFLLVPLQYSPLQYPVGYFLVNKVNSRVQMELVKTALAITAEKGIRVRNITCDGAAANQTMLSELGCLLDPTNPKPYFLHPQLGHKVYGTLDICHMLKLARNALGDAGTIHVNDVSSQSQRICWQYVCNLATLQENMGLHFGNKLTSQHIDFQKQKMKVKLAAQVFSCSVADALQYLKDSGTEGFHDCEATIEFIRQIDRAFDVLNSKSKYGRGYKAPLTPDNLQSRKEIYAEFVQYLLCLEDHAHTALYRSRRKTFVVGFINTFNAVLMLAEELFKEGYTYLSTFRVSQDFVETLFSKIRRMGGHNNNPTAFGFRSALRKLLTKQSVSGSVAANAADCNSSSGLFSLEWSKRKTPISIVLPSADFDEEDVAHTLPSCDSYKENILRYMAGYIVRSLEGSIRCDNCITHLVDRCTATFGDHMYFANDKSSQLVNIKNRGGLTLPSDPVVHILIRCEQILALYLSKEFISKLDPAGRLLALFSRSYFEDRPSCSFNHTCELEEGQLSHCHELVRHVAAKFIDIRLKQYARWYNRVVIRKKKSKDRGRLNRLIIFKHQ